MKKKSKIFFILTAIFVIITIGAFFYKDSSAQTWMNFVKQHPEVWSDSWQEDARNGKLKPEKERIERQYRSYGKVNEMANTIFNISCGITIVIFATGIVLVIVEKKKKQRNM